MLNSMEFIFCLRQRLRITASRLPSLCPGRADKTCWATAAPLLPSVAVPLLKSGNHTRPASEAEPSQPGWVR